MTEDDLPSCGHPDCDEVAVYLGLCHDHAVEEVGPANPERGALS